MAAKKDTTPKTAGPAADKKAALETALAQIEKQFGKGAVMKLGANVTMQVLSLIHILMPSIRACPPTEVRNSLDISALLCFFAFSLGTAPAGACRSATAEGGSWRGD